MGKFFIEVVQDLDGTYYANMVMDGKPVQGLKEHVDYTALREDIRLKTGVVILLKKDMKFQQSGHKKYAYIDNTQVRADCRVTLDEMRNGWKPDFDSVPAEESQRKKTAVDDLLNHDKSFRYQLLDRLRSDCEYYLGYGNRCADHLWAGSEKEQIACMKVLWESFKPDEKPNYLSFDQILDYELKMVPTKAPLSQIIENASHKANEIHGTGPSRDKGSEPVR